MKWKDLNIGGVAYSLAHLQPFAMQHDIGGVQVTVRVTFGFHVFTDEKGNGPEIRCNGEVRSFCLERYHLSRDQLVDCIRNRFATAMAIPYLDKNRAQCYFCLDLYDYAIFVALTKVQGLDNTLKLHVISAYEVAQWGRSQLPKGKLLRMRYIMDMRNQGQDIKIKK